jgi:hypothetical protein
MGNWFIFKLLKFWRLKVIRRWRLMKESVRDQLEILEDPEDEEEEEMPLRDEELSLVEDFANILMRMKGYKPIHLSFSNDMAIPAQRLNPDEIYFDMLILNHEEDKELIIKEDLMLMRNWLNIESSSAEDDEEDEGQLEEIGNNFNGPEEYQDDEEYMDADRIIYASTTLSPEDMNEFKSPVSLAMSIAKRIWNSNGWEFCPVRCRIVKDGQSPMLFALAESEFKSVVNDRFADFVNEIEEPTEDDEG